MGVEWTRIRDEIKGILLDEGLQVAADPRYRELAGEVARLTTATLEAYEEAPDPVKLEADLLDIRRAATGLFNAKRIQLEAGAWRTFERVLIATVRGVLAGLFGGAIV